MVVYIDVPEDVCVIRLVKRLIDIEVWTAKGTFDGEPKDALVRQLDAVALWIDHYQRVRPMYRAGSRFVQQNADIVVNGLKTVDEITIDIVEALKLRR